MLGSRIVKKIIVCLSSLGLQSAVNLLSLKLDTVSSLSLVQFWIRIIST